MKIKSVFVLIFLMLLQNCSSYRESIGQYSLPVSNIKDPTKEGRTCYYTSNLKFWSSNIDFTVEMARKNGNITNITAIEKETMGNLFLRRKCLIVKGN